jgi:hypothetical protein
MDYKFNPSEAASRFKLGLESTRKQRERERKALQFMDPAFQWDENAKQARQGMAQGGIAAPARPMLTVSKIEQPIQLVKNQFRESNLGINVHPISEKANKETSQIFQGLIRHIERDSNAILPRSWAYDRAVEAGFGAYRVLTQLDEESDEPTDQKIVIEGIYDQAAVVFDPAAQKPDYRDGNWAFIVSYMPIEEFKTEYPEAKISQDSDLLEEVFAEQPNWVKIDGETRAVLVAEYFCKKHKKVNVAPGFDRIETTVYWHKVCPGSDKQFEVLVEQEWNGKYIPLIPVIGKQMQPFDNERRYQGLVEPSMDSQRGFNYAITAATETVALETKAPYIGAEGQFEGHESKWNTSNTRNWSYLEYKPVDLNGSLAPPPQRTQVDTSKLQTSIMLMQQFDAAIQATTFTPNPALGKRDRDESGKAIEALQNQSQASTSNYITNMAQISMTLEACILMDLIPRIYDREGRVIRILDMEDEAQEVIVNAPFVMGPEGRPQPAPPQMPGMTTSMPFQPMPKPKTYNLAEGKYGVSISIGKSYPTRMEQGKQTLMELFKIDPASVPLLLPTYMSFSDEPWAQEVEKITKKRRDQMFPGVTNAEEGQETPEQLRAMLEAEKKKSQEQQGLLQQAEKALENDEAKQQATLQKAEMDNQAKSQIEQIAAMLQIQIEKMEQAGATQLEAMKQQGEMDRLLAKQEFEERLAMKEQEHAERMAEKQAEQADKEAILGQDTSNEVPR